MSTFTDNVVKAAGIGGTAYLGWMFRKPIFFLVFLVLFLAASDCVFESATGKSFLTTTAAEKAESDARVQKAWEEDVWGWSVKNWVESGKFEKAAAKYAQAVDQIDINHCRDGDIHTCTKLRGKWVHVELRLKSDSE